MALNNPAELTIRVQSFLYLLTQGGEAGGLQLEFVFWTGRPDHFTQSVRSLAGTRGHVTSRCKTCSESITTSLVAAQVAITCRFCMTFYIGEEVGWWRWRCLAEPHGSRSERTGSSLRSGLPTPHPTTTPGRMTRFPVASVLRAWSESAFWIPHPHHFTVSCLHSTEIPFDTLVCWLCSLSS